MTAGWWCWSSDRRVRDPSVLSIGPGCYFQALPSCVFIVHLLGQMVRKGRKLRHTGDGLRPGLPVDPPTRAIAEYLLIVAIITLYVGNGWDYSQISSWNVVS